MNTENHSGTLRLTLQGNLSPVFLNHVWGSLPLPRGQVDDGWGYFNMPAILAGIHGALKELQDIEDVFSRDMQTQVFADMKKSMPAEAFLKACSRFSVMHDPLLLRLSSEVTTLIKMKKARG